MTTKKFDKHLQSFKQSKEQLHSDKHKHYLSDEKVKRSFHKKESLRRVPRAGVSGMPTQPPSRTRRPEGNKDEKQAPAAVGVLHGIFAPLSLIHI